MANAFGSGQEHGLTGTSPAGAAHSRECLTNMATRRDAFRRGGHTPAGCASAAALRQRPVGAVVAAELGIGFGVVDDLHAGRLVLQLTVELRGDVA